MTEQGTVTNHIGNWASRARCVFVGKRFRSVKALSGAYVSVAKEAVPATACATWRPAQDR